MSEEQPRYHVRCREFLNEDPEFPAYIIGVVEDTRGISDNDPDCSWNWGGITLDLADCFRRVRFDFEMDDPQKRANSLRKINLIAAVVNAVRDGIILEVASRNARPAPSKAEPAKTEVETTKAEREPATAENARVHFTSYLTTLGL
ncbi:MAG TPA: hypothetical protein VGO68_18715 [Pyrinomonadaceae bacterium]|jgi:hypothetical protein|nr:hypothetical protein [Pyrinomonadaceae bacterium]